MLLTLVFGLSSMFYNELCTYDRQFADPGCKQEYFFIHWQLAVSLKMLRHLNIM